MIYIISILMFLIFLETLLFKRGCSFDIYFGVPGSGKTTVAASICKKRLKKGGRVFSNVPILGAYKLNRSDIGKYNISNCLMILDEAGVDYNNRNFKSFSDEETYFFKLHRHYKVDIAMFSQDFEDMDIKLRKLATRYFLIQKSLVPFCISRRSISKFIGINDQTHQIEDQYKFKWFSRRLIFAPSVWKMFDTEERKILPEKEWEVYGE